MPAQTALTLTGNLSELSQIASGIAQFCRDQSLSEDVGFDLNLVLEELFTNTIRHGGCEGMEQAANILMESQPDGVYVEYKDRGAPYDPLSTPEPNLNAPIEERRPGGLGVHLVRQIMRDLRYHRADGWNRLTMRRPLERDKE